jgi:hypothetical protein
MDRMEQYLVRRIKELTSERWTRDKILQQLGALESRKKLEKLIDRISAA